MKPFGRNALQTCICLLAIFTIFYFYFQARSLTTNIDNTKKYAMLHLNRINLAWMNISSLELLYSSNVCLYKKPKVMILVTSHVENIDARNIIRRSYPKDLFHKFNAQIIFMLAVAKQDNAAERETQKEFQQYADIVQGNFIESYRNLTYKHLMGYKWTWDSCNSVEYIVKMDDDIVVNYYKLFEIINKSKSKFELMGHILDHMKPIRDVSNKWYVSPKEYQNDEYPNFLSGWIYVATAKAVRAILKQSNILPYFWIDDVFVTGMLREKAHINLTDIKQYFRYEPMNIECCVLNKYSCDFLAAPNGKNYKLNLKFSNHLWECRYKKICTLESNMKTSCWWQTNVLSMKNSFEYRRS